jgi:ATP-dependent DNA helicase PIF1
LEELFERAFPAAELVNAFLDDDFFAHRAILAIRNDQLPSINASLMEKMPDRLHTYYAVDKARTEDGESVDEVPREYLQKVDLPGLPPSILELKVGCPVMSLRNLRPRDGLCNGTRLVVARLERHVIEAKILT